MVIELFSDYLCPWCFIGAHRLRRVLATVDGPFALRFRAFQLRPGLPTEGIDRVALLEQQYGTAADPGRVPARVAETAAEEHLELDYAAMRRVPNTLAAHRLMAALQAHSDAPESTWALAERLFRAYFQEGVDLGDRDWLARLGAEFGVDDAEGALVDGSAAADSVSADLAAAAEREVVGVPNLWFAGRFSLPGVQGEETLRHFVERAFERLGDA